MLGLAVLVRSGIDPGAIEARTDALVGGLAGLAPAALALHAIGGALPGLALAGLAALALARSGERRAGAELVAGTLLTLLASGALKLAIGRERPEDALLLLGGGAHPSGHAARAAYFACFAIAFAARVRPRLLPFLAPLAVAYALAMGASRLVLQVHRAYDVLGGIALGVAVWAALVYLLPYPRARDRKRA